MAYLLQRTFTAPRVQIVQGGKLSHGTHDAYFPSAPSHPPPRHPVPWQTAPTLRKAGPFQLHSKLRLSSGTAAEALCHLLSNATVRNAQYRACVWVLLKYCSTYIMESTLLSSAALPRGVSVFLAVWCGIACVMEVEFVVGELSVPLRPHHEQIYTMG